MLVTMFANPSPLTNKLFSYIYGAGIDEILMMEQKTSQSTSTYYYHTNALGSTIAITDNTGAVTERYEYTAYGAVSIYNASYYRLEWSAIGNVYLFTGREYDAESGLYYYRTRHYNPQLGRFMQRDAIGIWGDMFNRGNGYSYVGNNGVNFVDPTGNYLGEADCVECVCADRTPTRRYHCSAICNDSSRIDWHCQASYSSPKDCGGVLDRQNLCAPYGGISLPSTSNKKLYLNFYANYFSHEDILGNHLLSNRMYAFNNAILKIHSFRRIKSCDKLRQIRPINEIIIQRNTN